jgi:hypothetical protein
MIEFQGFPKIPRLKREIEVTEKIDGTNAQIALFEMTEHSVYEVAALDPNCVRIFRDLETPLALYVGSRNRWIKPEDDNFGFAKWVDEHRDELLALGPGRHFGEWWGQGIQRRYGLDEKRFSLFNTGRWTVDDDTHRCVQVPCCHVVPVLMSGMDIAPDESLSLLREFGSVAAPGFMNPEGIVVFHTASRGHYKLTLEGDGGKWLQEKAACLTR